MSNSRRLRRALAASGVAHPATRPPVDLGAARSIAGKRGRGDAIPIGGTSLSFPSAMQRRSQGISPYRRTMVLPAGSRKNGSKPGRRGGVNRAFGKAKGRRR